MRKPYKLLLFTIIVFSVAIAVIVYRYERLLGRQQKEAQNLGGFIGGMPINQQYSAAQIIDTIKKSKEYLGDSITISDNGDITSSNQKFQGTIKAVLDSKDNMGIVRNNAKTNRLPLQYNVYVLAAGFYRQQYASEFQTK